METNISPQSPFHKLNFGNSSPKTRKSIYQTFLDLSIFTGFLYFVPNILSRIWQAPEYATVKQGAEYACISLNMPYQCFNTIEYALIMLNMLKYAFTYLNKQNSDYVRILNVNLTKIAIQ